MNLKHTGLVAGVLLVLALPAAPYVAATPGGHCPEGNSGFRLWPTSTEPYRVDNLVDDRGNQNGMVCAKPGDVVIDENGQPFQLYNFIDDAGQLR